MILLLYAVLGSACFLVIAVGVGLLFKFVIPYLGTVLLLCALIIGRVWMSTPWTPIFIQAVYGSGYELFKWQMGWHQCSMQEIIALAQQSNAVAIEPYVDYVTWLNTDSDEFLMGQAEGMYYTELFTRQSGANDPYFGHWNRASVANVRWLQLAAIQRNHTDVAEVFQTQLTDFIHWHHLHGTSRSCFHTMDC